MNTPLLSIVIPNFNYGRFFSRIAHALGQQTFGLDSVEIILVDDGSTDGSRQMTSPFDALPTHAFKPLWLDHCGSPGTVRNHGLAQTAGDYLLCLDPDDIPAPDYVSACITSLKRNPDAGLAYTDFILEEKDRARTVRLPDFAPALLANQNILPPSAVIRRSVWEKSEGYRDNTTYEDWDFWIQAALNGHEGIRVPRPLFTHVVHGDNFSFTARQDDARAKAAIVQNNPGFFPAGVRHWAEGVMNGEPWAYSFPRGIIPLLEDVSTLLKLQGNATKQTR